MSKRFFSRREDKIKFLSPSSGHLMFCLFLFVEMDEI